MVRVKHRYLLIHILYPDPLPTKSRNDPPTNTSVPDVVQFHGPSPDDLTPQIFIKTLKDQVHYLYGDYGLGLVSSGLVVKYLSPATSTIIIRCSRNHYRLVWASLSFMTHLPITPSQEQARACVMQVVRVSGTIKKAEEEAIRRARAAILKARREEGDGGTAALTGLLREEEVTTTLDTKGEVNSDSDGAQEEDEMTDDADDAD